LPETTGFVRNREDKIRVVLLLGLKNKVVVVVTWNSLPESVIAAETTNCFKNRLDKFWNNQEMVFDYKAELTGIGKRSNII